MLEKIFASQQQDFARSLAADLLAEIGDAARQRDAKFRKKSDQALARADRRIAEHVAGRRLNWWQRARAGNAFLWALRDAGCPDAYASELAEWFVMRLQAAK